MEMLTVMLLGERLKSKNTGKEVNAKYAKRFLLHNFKKANTIPSGMENKMLVI